MSRALAIETSGRIGSVAVAQDGVVLAEETFPHGLKHAAGLVPMIDRLCSGAGWRPADVQEIYVSVGPGSFTGLRVGVTVAKTLAFATGARIVAVPTVEVLTRNVPLEAADVVPRHGPRLSSVTAAVSRAELSATAPGVAVKFASRPCLACCSMRAVRFL